MAKRTKEELAKRLAELEMEFKTLRQDLKTIGTRSREAVKNGKQRRDEGLIAALRKQLGLE